MKRLTLLLFILSIISCTSENKNSNDKPQRVVVSGKVLNFSKERQYITLNINRIGFSQERLEAPFDSEGNFSASFDSYIPTDIWIGYRKHFLVLSHPGDSIYLEFDGTLKKEAEILKTIKFGGSNAKSNREAATFQRMYFLDPQNTIDSLNKVFKESDVDQFRNYLDSSRIKSKTLLQRFTSEVHPNEEVKIWASEFLDNHIDDRIFFYPFIHQRLNNLEYKNNFNDMPADLFASILEKSISKSMFISGAAVSSYFRNFIGAYKQVNNQYRGKLKAPLDTVPRSMLDSLTVYSLLKSSKNSLFTQLVLTTLFSQRISMESDIDFFEKYQNVLEQQIKEPFLRKPLFELYRKHKQELDSQISGSEVMQKEIANMKGKQLLDSIISSNKGKVIYLDCWATWCGPCKAEMPNSKALMEELRDKDVVFAFLCLHSEKKDWQPTIDKLHIGGQHYFLPKNQSINFAKFYAINGVPNYMLINKHGEIIDQGTHLRPNVVKEKIEKMLKE